MIRKTKLIALFLLFFLPIFVNAQVFTLKGKIMRSNNKPIEFANVRIMNVDSVLVNGGVTDANGNFSINLQQGDDYFLLVSYIGFQDKYIALSGLESSVDIGTIVLKGDNKMLGELVVTAKQQINQLEKSLIFPSDLNKKHASNGFELLNNMMIPQLNIDLLNKQVSARGKDVTLLINGRPISTKAEITGLRPQDILRVEYHDMPTGVFSEYEVALDFITRQYNYGGYIGIEAAQQLSYMNGTFLAMARLNRNNSEYSLAYSFDFIDDKSIRRDINETFYYPDNQNLHRNETGLPSIEKKRAYHVFFNYNYRKDSVQVNVKTGYKNVETPENQMLSSQLYDGRFNYSMNLMDNSTERNKNPYLSFYTNWKLKNKQDIRIRGSIDYLKNYYNRYYEESQENEPATSFRSIVNEDFYSIVLGATYLKKFSKDRDISFIVTNFTDISKSKYEGTSNNNDRLAMSETLYLLNLSKKWSKLYLSLRLGGSSLQQFQKDLKNKHYWSHRPGVTMRYIINPNNILQYRVLMANSFPLMVLYNNVEQSIDFLQKRKGNPSLKIQQIFDNRFNYSFTSNHLNVDYVFNHVHTTPGIIRRVNYDGESFIHSYFNYGTHNFLNSEIGIALKLLENRINVKINGGVYHYLITGDTQFRETNFYLNPMLMILYKNININMFYNSPRKGLYPTSDSWTTSERYGMTATYSKKGLSFTLGTQNPFSTYKRTVERNFGDYSSQSYFYNSQNHHLFYVKLNYNFSFGQKHKYSDININKGVNSAIMKGSKD
ncbi:MAG: TonB-dependent receptor [Phycisphaerae bacterium]|nr:TonB-dependent receptor [Candidatus Paceibacterota bacterium]